MTMTPTEAAAVVDGWRRNAFSSVGYQDETIYGPVQIACMLRDELARVEAVIKTGAGQSPNRP